MQTKGVCVIEGCKRPKKSAGLCSMHYERRRQFGNAGTAELRRAENGTGYVTCEGYRQIRVDGHQRLEHDVIWERANGPIPDGYEIHHINGVRLDNRLDNFQLLTKAKHASLRRPFGEVGRDSCIVDGCGQPYNSRNMCASHYYKWWKVNRGR